MESFIFLNYIFIGISFFLAGLSLYWWYKYGVDREVIETVEFYPPEGMNSAEVGYAYKLSSNNNDVVSLLIYLANKGYLKIQENNTKDSDFTLIKVKDYDGNNENERIFLEGLFSEKNEVQKEDLKESFYKVIETIKFNLQENKFLFYEKKSSKIRTSLFFIILFTFICSLIKPIYEGYESEFIAASILSLSIFIGVIALLKKIIKKSALIVSIITLILSSILFLSLAFVEFENDMIFLIVYFISMISITVQFLSFAYMGKRTVEGNQILGKLSGFKNFLKTAEKERLETLVLDDPKYFYNILPYTYVFGISNKWIKKFESIAISPPDWYDSYNSNTFDIYVFSNFMDTTIANAKTAMTSIPSSSSGSYSSGGGFSGGGSSGGGGSSW